MKLVKTLALTAVITMLAACDKAAEEGAAPVAEETPAVEVVSPAPMEPAIATPDDSEAPALAAPTFDDAPAPVN